jgi:hypothetical protein
MNFLIYRKIYRVFRCCTAQRLRCIAQYYPHHHAERLKDSATTNFFSLTSTFISNESSQNLSPLQYDVHAGKFNHDNNVTR